MDPTQTVTFTGVISEGIFGSAQINKDGRGTLVFTGVNTYSGATILNNGGTLVLSGAGSLLNSNAITIGTSSTLKLDNTGTNNTNRLNDLVNVTNNGGKWHFVGNALANSREDIGLYTASGSGTGEIRMENTSGGAVSSVLTAVQFAGFTQTNPVRLSRRWSGSQWHGCLLVRRIRGCTCPDQWNHPQAIVVDAATNRVDLAIRN